VIYEAMKGQLAMSESGGAKEYLMSLLSGYPDIFRRIDEIIAAFERYADLLMAWNRVHNLTAFKSKEEILVRGIIDSLIVLNPRVNRLVQLTEHNQAADFGSGAGFPGIPLAVVKPAVDFTLIEATHKKAAFLSFVAAELGLENVRVFRGRVEEFSRLIERKEEKPFDIIFSRAAARINKAIKLSLPLLGKMGKLVVWSSMDQLKKQETVIKEIMVGYGCKVSVVEPDYELQLHRANRTALLVVEKI